MVKTTQKTATVLLLSDQTFSVGGGGGKVWQFSGYEIFSSPYTLYMFFLMSNSHIKYRRHTDPNGGYDQNEIKRNKALNYFKQNCPIFRFAIQTFLRGWVEKEICKKYIFIFPLISSFFKVTERAAQRLILNNWYVDVTEFGFKGGFKFLCF